MSISLTALTFNIRSENPQDGEHVWERRRDLCVEVVKRFKPVIVCTQEGHKSQLEYLKDALPGYEYFGVSRKGAQEHAEEHCAIFFDTAKVERMDGGTFWLSESPSIAGSKAWRSGAPRIATWATFQIKRAQAPGFAFQVVNTQLDKVSRRARRRGALLTWQHIASLPASLPVIYCGDFNSDKDSTQGRFLMGRSRIHGVAGDMRDAWASARRRRNGGTVRTYHGFRGEKQGFSECLKGFFRSACLCWDRHTQDLHSDWILFRGRALAPLFCEVVVDNKDGRFPSDHYPIFVEFLLPRSVRLAEDPVQRPTSPSPPVSPPAPPQ